MGHTIPALHDKSLFIEQCFINGKWTSATSSKTFEVQDPATGKVIGTCAECSEEDAHRAVAAAKAAFPSFSALTGRQRSKILRKWYDLMIESADDIAYLITWESGKPLADAKGEAAYAANFLEWFSEEAPRIYGDTYSASTLGKNVVGVRQPIGV